MPYFDLQQLRDSASGRWREILTSAGMPSETLDGRGHPCPKCGGQDRFSTFRDFEARGAVHCRACFTSGCLVRPGNGFQTLRWWLGCSFGDALQFVADAVGASGSSRHPVVALPSIAAVRPTDQGTLAHEAIVEAHEGYARSAFNRLGSELRARLATALHVTSQSLRELRVGATACLNSSTWPLCDEKGNVVGVRICGLPWTDRATEKRSRPGGRNGLFLPMNNPIDQSQLWITEGASDTAAGVCLGLWVVGRASCNSSATLIRRYIDQRQPRSITLIADHDTPGIEGATRLAKSISDSGPPVNVVVPPSEKMDLRSWVSHGARRHEIQNATPIGTFRRPVQLSFAFS